MTTLTDPRFSWRNYSIIKSLLLREEDDYECVMSPCPSSERTRFYVLHDCFTKSDDALSKGYGVVLCRTHCVQMGLHVKFMLDLALRRAV